MNDMETVVAKIIFGVGEDGFVYVRVNSGQWKLHYETIAQRGCSFCQLVPGVFLTILVCFAAWGLIFKVKNTS